MASYAVVIPPYIAVILRQKGYSIFLLCLSNFIPVDGALVQVFALPYDVFRSRVARKWSRSQAREDDDWMSDAHDGARITRQDCFAIVSCIYSLVLGEHSLCQNRSCLFQLLRYRKRSGQFACSLGFLDIFAVATLPFC